MKDFIKIHNKKINLISVNSDGITSNNLEFNADYYYYDDIKSLFPDKFNPLAIYFSFPEYYFVPIGLEYSNCLSFALVSDWNLNFLYLKETLKVFDFVLTDKLGVSVFQNHGFNNVFYFKLFGLQVDDYKEFKNIDKIYDISFIGNLNNNIQVKRAEYLYKLSQLSYMYNILITSNVYGNEYKRILAQSKITFDFTIRGELNIRVFEAMNANSLLFLEDTNIEYKDFLEPDKNVVLYNYDNLYNLVEYYLESDNQRKEIMKNAENIVNVKNQQWFESELFNLINTSPFRELLSVKQIKNNDISILKNDKLSGIKISILINLLKSVEKNHLYKLEIDYKNVIDKIQNIDDPEIINLYLSAIYLKNDKTLIDNIDSFDSEDTINAFNEYIDKYPEYIPLKINLINILIQNNYINDAEIIIDGLIYKLENKIFILDNLRGYFINENYTRFLVEYERAIAFNDINYLNNVILWNLYGYKIEITTNTDIKISYLKKAVKIIENSDNYFKLANLTNDKIEAYNYSTKALSLNPFSEDIILTTDKLADLIGINYEDRQYIHIIESCPLLDNLKVKINNYQYKNLKNKISKINNETNNQVKIIEKLPNKIIDDLEIIEELAEIYFKNEYYKKALDLYIKIIQIKGKKDLIVIDKIKICLEKLGDYQTLNKL